MPKISERVAIDVKTAEMAGVIAEHNETTTERVLAQAVECGLQTMVDDD